MNRSDAAGKQGMGRRFGLLMAVIGLALPVWAIAQVFPDRPLRLVVPFPPGGPTDIVARPLAQLLGDALGQSVIVDNRGGAGGSIGADAVAKAAPDGYTLLMGTVGTHAINGALYRKLPHDPVRDFTPIALAASAPIASIVRSDAFRDRLGNLGVVPSSEPLSLPESQRAEVVKWGRAVRDSGAAVD